VDFNGGSGFKSVSSDRARASDPDRAEIACFYFKAAVNIDELNYPVSPEQGSYQLTSTAPSHKFGTKKCSIKTAKALTFIESCECH
jgi:hypothetical protein